MATESCMRDRRSKDRLAVLRELLATGELKSDVQVTFCLINSRGF